SDLDAWCRITFDKDYYSNPAFYSKKLYLNGIRVTEVKFPDGIEKVSDFVFVNCINIKTVSLPASVTSIGEKAFYNINNLTSIVIPRDVTSIGVDAFRGCDYLSDITLWGKVGSIGNDAFYGCSRLKNVYYLGTSDEYAAMTVGTNNESFTGATLNYFCKHAWSEWSVASQPTCIDEGLEQRTCGICEQTETQAVDALDHDYGLTETVEPDCTSDGYSVYTCTRCGDWYYDDFEATLGHAFMHEYIIDVEPTCTERGEAHTMCERCYHVEHFPLEALEHDYDAEFVDPDCTSEGYTIYTCRRCFDTYIDDFIDALGHDHQYGGMVEPSCEERGFTIYACTRCGDGYEADFIDALGHDHVGEVTEPTCTEDGYTTYTCSRCGDSYIDDYVGVLDHNYELTETVEPDCTSDGYSVYTCTGCGDWYYDDFEAPLGHAFMHEYIIDVEPTCTERGEAHTMCERCYHVEHFLLEALEHDYDAEFVDPDCTSEGYTIYTCRRCFDTFIDDFIEALGHEYVQTETAPDCTSEGYTTHTCTRCADEYTDAYVDALGHEWGEWIVDVIATDMHEGSSHRDCIRGDLTEYKTIALIVVDAAAGDMDADGRYTNADIALLVRYLSGWDIWSDGGFASLSDVNADGKVNNRDALSLIKTVYEAELAQKYEGYTPIKTADDLEKIREDLSGKYYLVCDITLEGEWITIADSTGSAFEGIIEGNGHKIKGVYINKNVTDPTCVGFVGYNKGVINNLTVEGEITIVNGQNKNTMYAGGIAGYNYGRIENSVVKVKIIASNRHEIG
ncbi:MAG: leucine-rich repeat protein, partial [Clostridia bacterium]|nr:leucine-rich repeat protein [Clostridia bacterium]